MPDAPAAPYSSSVKACTLTIVEVSPPRSNVSLRELWEILVRRRSLILLIEGGLLLACLTYCLLAPNQYDASAKVEMRTAPASSLTLDSTENSASASILSAPTALETIADVFRSEQLAWRVIKELKLYEAPGFRGDFATRFPGFRGEAQSGAGLDPAAQAWLLDKFEKRLRVQTVTRTLLIEIRFRSTDGALSAAVVNALIAAYNQQDSAAQLEATAQASDWLNIQLKELKASVDEDQDRLSAFEKDHGILSAPETLANGTTGETEHSSTLLEIDELGRQLVAAKTDRILREAEYRTAVKGDPELVIASDPGLQAVGGGFLTATLQQNSRTAQRPGTGTGSVERRAWREFSAGGGDWAGVAGS